MPRDSVADFAHVDRSADTAELIQCLDAAAEWPAIRTSKNRSLDLVEIRPGDRVLDVGSGEKRHPVAARAAIAGGTR